MTKEQALVDYIKFMGRSTLPESKRDAYVKDARSKLNYLRENKLSDNDKYNALEKEYQEIRQGFVVEKPETVIEFNLIIRRFREVGEELTTLWEETEDIFA